jgi:hypothetical protein
MVVSLCNHPSALSFSFVTSTSKLGLDTGKRSSPIALSVNHLSLFTGMYLSNPMSVFHTYCPHISPITLHKSHAKICNSGAAGDRPFKICRHHIEGTTTDVPASMLNNFSRRRCTGVAGTFFGNMVPPTMAVHVERPIILSEPLAQRFIKFRQILVPEGALERQEGVHISIAEIMGGPTRRAPS